MTKNILVVDDVPDNLRLLVGILTNRGYVVRPASSGLIALSAVQVESPDLILLDIMMPEMTGYEVCEQLKADKRTRDIPVIFITAMDKVQDKIKAFAVGGIDYITKPFQVKEVLARVETHLTIRSLQKSLQDQNLRLQEENTRRMRVMDALKESRERYRLLAENSTDIISRQTPQGIYLYVSPACRPLLGYRIEEMVSHYATEFIHPQDLPAIQAIYANLAKSPQVSTITYRARRKDNSYIWLETTNKIIRGSKRNIVHEIIAVSRDVTERKQAEQRMQDELDLAREIQRGLLPPSNPGWPNLEVVCYSEPAREVGGDFYRYYAFPPSIPPTGRDEKGDFSTKRDERISEVPEKDLRRDSPLGEDEEGGGGDRYAFAIGDVSGKGVSAALLMAASVSQFDASLSQEFTPRERLAYLDSAIAPYTKPRRQNCALCYIELIPPQSPPGGGVKGGKLHIVNAGCIPPYIRRKNASLEWPDVRGFALGQDLGATAGYQQVTLNLSKGDLVILTSDGVVEANNAGGEMFGFERLEEIIESGPHSSAEAMLEHLKRKVFAFTGQAEQRDDLTIVVVQA